MAGKTNDKKVEKATPAGVAPDGGWGWVICISSFMISVLVDGVCFSQGIFFKTFMDHFNSNKANTSLIGSVLNGSYLIIGPFVGMAVNKFDCRRVAFTGAFLAAASFFASTFSPDIRVLTFLYGFMGGLGFGLMYLPAIVMVGYYFDKKRALATGIACCGSGIGMFVFAPLSEFLITEFNWKGATWIMSGLVLNGAIFSMLYRPLPADESEAEMEMQDMSEKESKIEGAAGEPLLRCRSVEMNLNKPVNKHLEVLKGGNGIARLAHSHGAIGQLNGDLHSSHKHLYMQPLERKDIFYSGSIQNLKEFNQIGSTKEFTKAMTRSHQSLDAMSDHPEPETCCGRVKQEVLGLFDLSLLKSPTFLIYGLACMLCMLGFFVPFTYIPPLAVDLGIPMKDAAFLISIIGIANTIGRVVAGFISDQSWADCLLINNLALIIAGGVTILVPFYNSYGLLAAYVTVFGSGIAVFVSLRSIIMVELMGLEKLTSAFGLVIMFQGLSSYMGAPIAGSIADYFGNYNAAFYLAGSTLALSGAMCLPLRKIARWEQNRGNKNKNKHENQPMIDDVITVS